MEHRKMTTRFVSPRRVVVSILLQGLFWIGGVGLNNLAFCSDVEPGKSDVEPGKEIVPATASAIDSAPVAAADSAVEAVAPSRPADAPAQAETTAEAPTKTLSWDFDPYRVLILIASDRPEINAQSIGPEMMQSLERDFFAVWRVAIEDAPASLATIMQRDMQLLSYQRMTAADPILVIKKDHPKNAQIRTIPNVIEFISKIHSSTFLVDQLQANAPENQTEVLAQLAKKIEVLPANKTVAEFWTEDTCEAMLTTQGKVGELTQPKSRSLPVPSTQLFSKTIDQYDKIFFVRVRRQQSIPDVTVIEMDTLMRHFGAPAKVELEIPETDADRIVSAITEAFRPILRIDEAGRKNATGLIRAGGLIVDPKSPASLQVGDILEPMIRMNDRNGVPFLIGPMDWSFLLTTKVETPIATTDFWTGRSAGLQGRKNDRTFRMALRVRPKGRSSELRLHAKGDAKTPLIGYEIYEKDLDSEKAKFDFVGRTDWDGRLQIDPTQKPFRLLYVKNGGAILARLPIVPGLHPEDVADIIGDDDRLRAEAYIKGVENAAIDLVAIRELYKTRIRLRLERGDIKVAEELMLGLAAQPTSAELSDALGKKQTDFLKEIKNKAQQKKIDIMFSATRDMLSQFINPKLELDLEQDLLTAKKNGGKLPVKKEDKD
jgi:hypothetical protein